MWLIDCLRDCCRYVVMYVDWWIFADVPPPAPVPPQPPPPELIHILRDLVIMTDSIDEAASADKYVTLLEQSVPLTLTDCQSIKRLLGSFILHADSADEACLAAEIRDELCPSQ